MGGWKYYPERTIPFAGSRFKQTILAELQGGAEFGLSETLASGRVHSGERLAFAEYGSRVEVRQAGLRVYLEQQKLVPDAAMRAAGIWGNTDYAASGVWLGAGTISEWPSQTKGSYQKSHQSCNRLATGLSAGGAVWLRSVASSGPALDNELKQARESLRQQLFGAVPLQIRR